MESADSRRLATKHSRKALKASLTLGILLGMFFVTWLPFFVANIAQVMPLQGAGESRPLWGGPELHPSPDMGMEEGGCLSWHMCLWVPVPSVLAGVVGEPAPGPSMTYPVSPGCVRLRLPRPLRCPHVARLL